MTELAELLEPLIVMAVVLSPTAAVGIIARRIARRELER